VRVTVLIETITAAFEAEEILYELREHASGLNCGRWDYMFSFVKKLRTRSETSFPDRTPDHDGSALPAGLRDARDQASATATAPMPWAAWPRRFRSRTIRRRTRPALAKVRADKEREARSRPRRHLGRASRASCSAALEAFAIHMKGPNQLAGIATTSAITAADLLAPLHGPDHRERACAGTSTWACATLRPGWEVPGAEPIHHLMEDLATSEISRSQLWQWLRFGAKLDDGRADHGGPLREFAAGRVGRDPR
jgi:malate synthase